MSLRHAEREFNKMGLKGLARAISGIRQELKDRKNIEDIALPVQKIETLPLSIKPIVEQLDLDSEWLDQSQKYIGLGFHTELGLKEQEYIVSLPRFEDQPENFRGRFDLPVIVETRISPQRQAELAGLNYFLVGLEIKDWEKDPKGYKTPDKPYIAWMNDGKLNLRKSVENVRKAHAEDERGATIHDGIALYITNSDVLKDHFIDLPGTQVGSDGAPALGLWGDGPLLVCSRVDDADPRFGSASCGRV